MGLRLAVAGLSAAVVLAVASPAGARTPAPPTLPAGCVVTSAGLQCPQLPQGCLVTSAGLQCPPRNDVESATDEGTATVTPTATPTPKPRRRVNREQQSSPPAPVATAAAAPAPLPFTGGEALPLAALGALLVGAGLALRRRSAPS